MKKKTVRVQMPNGMEMRPIAMLVQISSQCASEVRIRKGERWMNAKSLLGMMTLDIGNGEEVEITTEGMDEDFAMVSICEFLSENH
ncbi:MAG: HPr family phosphocarrier protein [Lachnospiraceae bacterium]|nr:HPr family phosphocarrier protein [Lachnospiraceae bacterium]